MKFKCYNDCTGDINGNSFLILENESVRFMFEHKGNVTCDYNGLKIKFDSNVFYSNFTNIPKRLNYA